MTGAPEASSATGRWPTAQAGAGPTNFGGGIAPQDHWPLLDAIRGVAAMAVVWFHLHFVVGYDCAGPLAVDIFFMLSGFVVAAAYDAKLDRDLSFTAFCKRRLIRLYPLFLVGLVIALAAQQILILHGAGSLTERDTMLSFVFEAFWLPSPFNSGTGWTFPIDGPAWSLSLEIFINILFAAFHRRMSNRLLAFVSASCGIALIWGLLELGTINFGWTWDTLPLGIARVGYAFPLGVLLFRHRDLIPRYLAHIPPIIPLTLLAIALFSPEAVAIDIALLIVGGPLLIAIGFRNAGSRFSHAFQVLGAISYPLYAIHGPLVTLIQGVIKQLHLGRWGLALGIVSLCTMACAALPLARWDIRVRSMLTASFRRKIVLGRID